MPRWEKSNKATYNLGYHLIWCPKYRLKVLVGDVEKRLKELNLKILRFNNNDVYHNLRGVMAKIYEVISNPSLPPLYPKGRSKTTWTPPS